MQTCDWSDLFLRVCMQSLVVNRLGCHRRPTISMLDVMGRKPRAPRSLRQKPFTLAAARANGLDSWHLHGSTWRKLGPATFVSARIGDTPRLQLDAASLRLPPGTAFSGLTAAWLHGLQVEPCDPIEVIAPLAVGIAARVGMRIRRCELSQRDVVSVQGLPATSIHRTLRDLCLHMPLVEAVVMLDMALHLRLTTTSALSQCVDRSAGSQGVRQLRKALEFVEPASESPMETRLRMLLVLGGLPRPDAQVTIRDALLRTVGRLDLYYRDQRLGLEYDGSQHRDTLAEDNRRQNRLLEAGVRLLRFTAGDVFNTPDLVLAQVRTALAA